MRRVRQHLSLLLTLAAIPAAVAMALGVARAAAAQTSLERCAELGRAMASGPAVERQREYWHCLADPAATRQGATE